MPVKLVISSRPVAILVFVGKPFHVEDVSWISWYWRFNWQSSMPWKP